VICRQPAILAVKEGARLLETACYKEWWSHYKQNEALFKQVPNFSKKIQQCKAGIVFLLPHQ